MVKLDDEKEQASLQRVPCEELKKRLEQSSQVVVKDIMVLKQLPSGDIVVFTKSGEARQHLETNKN